MVESSEIARGILATDAALKAAPVRVLWSRPVDPGRYLVLVSGLVEEVEASLRAARQAVGEALVEEVLIPDIHPGVIDAILAAAPLHPVDALGVIECRTVASLLLAADRAAKEGAVRLLRIRIALHLGGKAYVTLTGEVSDVEAAVSAAARAVRDRRGLVGTVVIPRPDDGLLEFLG